jgi:hypothetical protein
MIKIPKNLAFFLMIVTTIGTGFAINNINWEHFNENTLESIYKELRMPSICLSLSIYFMLYYVRVLKNENKA